MHIFSNKEYSFSKNYSDNQVFQIVKLGIDPDKSWESVANTLNKKWFLETSPEAYRAICKRFKERILALCEKEQEPNPYEHLTRDAIGEIVKVRKKKKARYIITAVGMGQKLHVKGFNAILNYCQTEKAIPVLLPMRAHVKALYSQPTHYDPELEPFLKYFATEFVMSPRIKALELQINPQRHKPLTGLHQIRGKSTQKISFEDELEELRKQGDQKKISLIVGHSRQHLEIIATGNDTPPKINHTTGAITEPDYLQDTTIGIVATEKHVLGAVIVEVDGDKFHFRQIQINAKDGSFCSLGKKYKSNGKISKVRAKYTKIGDSHPGHDCPIAHAALFRMWEDVNPEALAVEDWADGTSISHHLENDPLAQSMLPKVFLTMQNELDYIKKYFAWIRKKAPKNCKLYATPSNHPDFFIRYLKRGKYIQDKAEGNYILAHKMVVDIHEGKHHLHSRIDPEGHWIFPKRNEDIFIEGIQVNVHGDKAANGAKGSKPGLEKTYSEAMSAHDHTGGIYGDLFVVGHMSVKRHGYNEGATTWLNGCGNIYPGGGRELIYFINGEYKI